MAAVLFRTVNVAAGAPRSDGIWYIYMHSIGYTTLRACVEAGIQKEMEEIKIKSKTKSNRILRVPRGPGQPGLDRWASV